MRYITPEKCVRIRLGDRPAPSWKAALLMFRDFPSSKVALDVFAPVSPVRYRMLYNLTSEDFEPFVFEALVDGVPIGIVTRCVWGGPQAAILVEELAALGVRTIVGYGVAGSIDKELKQGDFVVATSALATDGTSQAYAADATLTSDQDLLQKAMEAGKRMGRPFRAVTAATVDALYQETPELVDDLRKQGGQIVQMECSTLYAVSRVCGVRSLWLGYISDSLVGEKWQDWDKVIPNANEDAIRLCREVLGSLKE